MVSSRRTTNPTRTLQTEAQFCVLTLYRAISMLDSRSRSFSTWLPSHRLRRRPAASAMERWRSASELQSLSASRRTVYARFESTFTNVLNHTNFATPATVVDSPSTFGALIGAQTAENAGNRTGRAALRVDILNVVEAKSIVWLDFRYQGAEEDGCGDAAAGGADRLFSPSPCLRCCIAFSNSFW
jgi:hypothetical protein